MYFEMVCNSLGEGQGYFSLSPFSSIVSDMFEIVRNMCGTCRVYVYKRK